MNSPSISPSESSLRLIPRPQTRHSNSRKRNAVNVFHEVWRALELVSAGLEVGLHS